MTSWKIFKGTPEKPHNDIKRLPKPPSWRTFEKQERGSTYQAREQEIELVNAALYLRRPLLVTGKPGTGKTSLAYAVAKELNLGEVLRWNITTRSTLQQGLYSYDAIGRLQDAKAANDQDNLAEIGKYIQLGSLGTALFSSKLGKIRVLLIDEMDKSDIDLPNDLLNIFEEGEFDIPELARIANADDKDDKNQLNNITVKTYDNQTAGIVKGKVKCQEFPFVILTSNGEREFPPAFLRRCLRLDLPQPSREELENIVKAHFLGNDNILREAEKLIGEFVKRGKKGDLATDQLLNAIYILTNTRNIPDSPKLESVDDEEKVKDKDTKTKLVEHLLRYLNNRD
ncbi:MAG: MoxR family ATPase [Rhizonema sp. PD38]|nr:MoxR family ATPase [Rhizonema sp. PD38]